MAHALRIMDFVLDLTQQPQPVLLEEVMETVLRIGSIFG